MARQARRARRVLAVDPRRDLERGELKGAHVGRGLFVARADFDAWMRTRADAHAVELGGAVVDDDPIEQAIRSGKLRRVV